ncbi:MAG: helix-turn-helix transcriptional regulator [Treponema sp.]|nr:helix-turn-helix transcriptional regulator [Treponema sp.]
MGEENTRLSEAIDTLSAQFSRYDWTYHDFPTADGRTEKIFYWFGPPEEEVMVCVLKQDTINEQFHRHGFFFINYAYRGSYDAVSYKFDNKITIRENECYIGQPFSGYALHCNHPDEQIIIGVLIQKPTFYRSFLPLISGDADLFRFFVDSRTNDFADEFIHLKLGEDNAVRRLLELMVIEYANKDEHTQNILKPMALSLLMYLAREYRAQTKRCDDSALPLSAQIENYMKSHLDAISLAEIAAHFGYHANYISSLLHKDTGRTFSQILLRLRMERATLLMQGTTLTLDEIATMLGYGDTSNFYKAFKGYYGVSPRKLAGETRGK